MYIKTFFLGYLAEIISGDSRGKLMAQNLQADAKQNGNQMFQKMDPFQAQR
jgi:hypothetical protein